VAWIGWQNSWPMIVHIVGTRHSCLRPQILITRTRRVLHKTRIYVPNCVRPRVLDIVFTEETTDAPAFGS
jgi:hypothetical protein